MNIAIHSVIVSSTVIDVGCPLSYGWSEVLQRNPSVEESKSVRILGVVFTNDPLFGAAKTPMLANPHTKC